MEKTNSGLLAYAKAQVGLPYWYGTYGQTASASLYGSKKKQYPKYYTASDFTSQYGKRVHDCVGLIKGYLWSESATAKPKYKKDQDKSARGMYNAATTKGKNSTFPGTAGLLVFKASLSTTGTINHVGIYDGNGYVYEAKGHAYGVVKTPYKKSAWKFWAQCPYTVDDAKRSVLDVDGKWGKATTTRLQQIFNTTVDGEVSNQWKKYEGENPGLTSGWEWEDKPNGKGSQLIKAMQKWADMPAKDRDGEFGPNTCKAFQKKLGTTVDGKVSNPSQMVKVLQKWANNQ